VYIPVIEKVEFVNGMIKFGVACTLEIVIGINPGGPVRIKSTKYWKNIRVVSLKNLSFAALHARMKA